MGDRARVALTVAVLSVELLILLNSLSNGAVGEWAVLRYRRVRWHLTRPIVLEQQTRRDAGAVIWEAIEATREAAEHDDNL